MSDELVAALRKEARCRSAELDFDGDLKPEHTLEWKAADEIDRLRSLFDAAKSAYDGLRRGAQAEIERLENIIIDANKARCAGWPAGLQLKVEDERILTDAGKAATRDGVLHVDEVQKI